MIDENAYGWTQVMIEARSGNCVLVKSLIDNGETLQATNKYGYTPLSLSVVSGCKETCVYIFNAMFISSIESLKQDKVAFGVACFLGEVEIVKIFLESQLFDVNEPVLNNLPPLLLAATGGSVKAAKVLLDAGANKYATNTLFQTGYDIAVYRNDGRMQALLTDQILKLPLTPLNNRTKFSPLNAVNGDENIRKCKMIPKKLISSTNNGLAHLNVFEQNAGYFESDDDCKESEDHSFCSCHYLNSLLSPKYVRTSRLFNNKRALISQERIISPKRSKLKISWLNCGIPFKRSPRNDKPNETLNDNENNAMENNLRITQLLTVLHLEEYISILIKHEFDAKTILNLKEQDLIEIGIECHEKRSEILGKLLLYKGNPYN